MEQIIDPIILCECCPTNSEVIGLLDQYLFYRLATAGTYTPSSTCKGHAILCSCSERGKSLVHQKPWNVINHKSDIHLIEPFYQVSASRIYQAEESKKRILNFYVPKKRTSHSTKRGFSCLMSSRLRYKFPHYSYYKNNTLMWTPCSPPLTCWRAWHR